MNRRLRSLKSMDLTPPRSSSYIRVHQRKESREGYRSTEVIVCLENQRPLVFLSCQLAYIGYKIVGANVEYRGPYEFLKGRVNKSENIDVGTLGEDEPENMIDRILDIATERGCPKVNT